MGNCLLISGLLFNSGLMVIDRFFKKISNKFYLPGLILGIVLMLIGMIQMKA